MGDLAVGENTAKDLLLGDSMSEEHNRSLGAQTCTIGLMVRLCCNVKICYSESV